MTRRPVPLYLTDGEIAAMLGLTAEEWRGTN